MKGTTSGRAVAPSTPPQGPLQNPSSIPEDRPPTREIAIIFPSSGQPLPPTFPSAPLEDRGKLSPSLSHLHRRREVFLFAVTVRTLTTPTKLSPPLAPLPSSTPFISGDKTSTVGCARMLRNFPLLAASAEELPFAADTDGKLARELCHYCCLPSPD